MKLQKSWIKPLARAGYSARGLVYLIVGVFAFLAAWGSAQSKNTKGALSTVMDQPFGAVLMWILVGGLCGYVFWRLIQAIFDTDEHGYAPRGLAVRAGLLASAATYTLLALYALSILGVASGSGEGDGGLRSVTRSVSSLVGTRWVALAFCLVFLGVAGAHFWKAFRRKYEDHFLADDDAMRFIHPVSIAGLGARGLVFAVIATLFFYRFLNAGSGPEHPGLKDALQFIQGLPFGAWLLGATGIGLVAFSGYSFIEAKWRRINVEDA